MAIFSSFLNNGKGNGSRRSDKDKPLTFQDRMGALRNLPQFFRLVWQTSPPMFVGNIILRIVRSALPVLMLYLGKLIIDEIVQVTQLPAPRDLSYLWQLVGLELVLAIVSDALSRAIALLDSLLGDLFANQTSIQLMEHAAKLDLDQFEDSTFYDKLERARQQTLGRTVLLAQVLGQVQDMITMVFLATGLVVFNPWLILLLVLAVVPAFLGEAHFNEKSYSLVHGWTPERRELDYLRYTGASDETAKEVKIFGLSNFLTDRYRSLSTQYYHANKKLAVKRASWGSLFAAIGSAGYYGAYVFIIWQTVSGSITLGSLTFMAGSFRQLRALLESMLNRFVSVSQGALYLRDLFDFFEIQPKINSPQKTRAFPRPIKHGFVFEDVGFKYTNSDKWANRHLSFHLLYILTWAL